MPFFLTENWDGLIISQVVFLMNDNGADADIDWNMYNFFDRDSIKIATRFFQYHLKNSLVNPTLAKTINAYNNTVKYVANINAENSKPRVQKYLIFLDYLLFDLIKIEDNIRQLYTNEGNKVFENYYKVVTVVAKTRRKLQNNGYISYLNIPYPSLVNCCSDKTTKASYLLGSWIANKSLNEVSEYLIIENLYKELELTKQVIKDNKLLCFIKYYNDKKERNKDLDLEGFVNSIRDTNFPYRTAKELEQNKINKRKEDIKQLFMLGLTLEEIAIQLDMSLRTIKYNFKDISLSEKDIKKAKHNRKLCS